eukprot:7096401-Pyramimonas_sp.AAC.1
MEGPHEAIGVHRGEPDPHAPEPLVEILAVTDGPVCVDVPAVGVTYVALVSSPGGGEHPWPSGVL